MAESDKPDSSTGKGKAKSSLLDDDISKDFLSSWKSMSVTGGDDMDFNFEPVTKGKKKSFDFGMDMDFSLDDAFGKMPSFKLDMPDIDFSTSPKKPSKSKENKPEEESAKGSRQDKNDKFSFSFDFNGMDDFSLDEPTTKGGKNATREKSTKQVGSSNNIDEFKDLPRQAASCSEAIREDGMHEELPKSEVAVIPSEEEKVVEVAETSGDCNFTLDTVACSATNTSKTMNSEDASNEALQRSALKDSPSPLEREKSTKQFGCSNKNDECKDLPTQAASCSEAKREDGMHEEPPTSEVAVIPGAEEEMIEVAETSGDRNFTLDTVACSATKTSKTMNLEVASNEELQRSALKDSPAPLESETTPAKPMLTRDKLSGATNLSMVRGTNDGAGTKILMLDRSKKGLTPLGTANLGDNPSSEGNAQKLYNNPNSCAIEVMERGSALINRDKHSDISRVGENNGNGEFQTKKVFDTIPGDRQAKENGFHSLDNRKLSFDVKPSGNQLPSLVSPEGVAKSGNQGYGKLKDRISSMPTVQKSNLGQVNRIPTQRNDKMIPSLPSLRMSRNITTKKQSSSSTVQDPRSLGNFDISTRLQVKSKMVSPVNVQNPITSISSLKRKPTEAADVHPSKRLSPSESRMSKVSAREVENEVQTQGTIIEGNTRNVTAENLSPKFDFRVDTNMENLGLTLLVERDANVEKAEACAKELENICTMLKKKQDEAKELLVRALVNNNNLLMLNHPIYEEKIRVVQRFASRLLSREQEAGV